MRGCEACRLEGFGVKSRVKFRHTCEKGNKTPISSLVEQVPTGKKCIAPCAEGDLVGHCECYPKR